MKKNLTIFVLLVAILAAAAIWIRDVRQDARRRECSSQLRSIGAVIDLYAEDHDGQFPPKLPILLSWSHLSASLLKCSSSPENDAGPAPGQTFEDWSDYLYVYWPDGKNTPKHYPIVYDRRLSNHNGQGVNILLIVGMGAPKTEFLPPVWDENAIWLSNFARKHAEFGISLPEDVK